MSQQDPSAVRLIERAQVKKFDHTLEDRPTEPCETVTTISFNGHTALYLVERRGVEVVRQENPALIAQILATEQGPAVIEETLAPVRAVRAGDHVSIGGADSVTVQG